MRRMSFALTGPQMLARTKTVTRRFAWEFLRANDRVLAVSKTMGIAHGTRATIYYPIGVDDVRVERVDAITPEDCAREGFPNLTPREFIDMLCDSQRKLPSDPLRRIAFHEVVGDERVRLVAAQRECRCGEMEMDEYTACVQCFGRTIFTPKKVLR